MNVRELVHILAELPPETEVRMAQQPHWAFEYSVSGAAVTDKPSDIAEPRYDTESDRWYLVRMDGWGPMEDGPDQYIDDDFETFELAAYKLAQLDEEHTPILYIAEGGQIGYLPEAARSVIGW